MHTLFTYVLNLMVCKVYLRCCMHHIYWLWCHDDVIVRWHRECQDQLWTRDPSTYISPTFTQVCRSPKVMWLSHDLPPSHGNLCYIEVRVHPVEADIRSILGSWCLDNSQVTSVILWTHDYHVIVTLPCSCGIIVKWVVCSKHHFACKNVIRIGVEF